MLAIIIPYYKITFFEETLSSLAAQTNKLFMVYIGDDASPENPEALLEKYIGKFNFQYHKFESNLGGTSLVQQWQRCVAFTDEEEWIMILGDDDVLGKNVVEEFYVNLSNFKSKTNVVRFASQIIDETEKSKSKIFTHPIWEKATDSCFRKFKGFTRSSLSEYIFLKESYVKCKFQDYSLAWHSDDYAWMAFSEDKPIFTINESVVFIRMSNINISGKNDNIDLKNMASAKFLSDIVSIKLKLFKKNQRLELLRQYEIAIKRHRSLDINDWFLLFKFYLRDFRPVSFLKFSRRFAISMLKL
jgi:glycosyltransferase involved in cell wall biosynthesis